MKSITKNLFFSILCFLSSLAIAGQNDYDGKWHVDFTCSINTKNQRPGFSYSEAWDIKGNRIQHIYKTTTKYGVEQTTWDGQITNQTISLKAEASRDNGDSWSWVGQGSISSPEAFQINAIMNDKFGAKIRDCVIKFASIDPAFGSLAYLKLHPQQTVQKVDPPKTNVPNVQPKQTFTSNLAPEIKKSVKVTDEPARQQSEEASEKVPAAQPSQSIEKKSASPDNSDSNNYLYLIAIGVALTVLVFGFILVMRKKGRGSENRTKFEEELKQKIEAQELKARELDKERERLKQLEQELNQAEAMLAKKNEQITSSTQSIQSTTPDSKFCVSCGNSIKAGIKFCSICGNGQTVAVNTLSYTDEKKANKLTIKIAACLVIFAAVVIFIIAGGNNSSSSSISTQQSQSVEEYKYLISDLYDGTTNADKLAITHLNKRIEFMGQITGRGTEGNATIVSIENGKAICSFTDQEQRLAVADIGRSCWLWTGTLKSVTGGSLKFNNCSVRHCP